MLLANHKLSIAITFPYLASMVIILHKKLMNSKLQSYKLLNNYTHNIIITVRMYAHTTTYTVHTNETFHYNYNAIFSLHSSPSFNRHCSIEDVDNP